MIKKIILIAVLFELSFFQSDCYEGRYIDDIFDVSVEYNIEYGENVNDSGLQSLKMDIYKPVGDDLEDRPVVIYMHGGSFVGGSKESADVVSLCNAYARRGYVAASISYRLTPGLAIGAIFPSLVSSEDAYKAVIKAIHDLKAAIRYFRMDDELYNNFQIDSDRIFVGGVSAGAIASLNAVYINDESEALSIISQDYFNSIGGLEGYSGNSGYSSNVSGIINLCGAIGDYNWIEEGDIPIVSMHGSQDSIVPYSDNSVTLFGLNVQAYGSYIINETMESFGNYTSLYTYEGEGHTPFNSSMSFEIDFTSEFLYNVVCSNSDILVGDSNGDGVVNISDIILAINFILELSPPTEEQLNIVDINSDGSLNIADIILMVNIILN